MRNNARRRGVTLTAQGSRKLYQAKVQAEIEHNLQRYTLESLSELTGLTPNTLSKVFTGSVGVDKRTLNCCFHAFNLTLSAEDYVYLQPEGEHLVQNSSKLSTENRSDLEAFYDDPFETLRARQCLGFADRRNTHPIVQRVRPKENLQPRFQALPGGQMPLDSVFYIDRPILESLCYEAICQSGVLLNIRAPKQMGKTSLMTRILAYAKTLGYHTVSLSLQLPSAEILRNLESFLKWFCARVSKQLGLPKASADFWDNSLGSKSNATDYFEDIILAKIDRPLVIAIDQLNKLFAYPDIAREFFLLLQTWSERARARGTDSNHWHKLRLVSVHSTEILMPSVINPSLLNTALVIKLPEFIPAQVQDLAERWEQEISAQEIEQLITLLGGHPYRLQLAFHYLQQQTITLSEILENYELTLAIYAEHLQQQWWNLQHYPELLTIFTQIVRQSSPVKCSLEQAYQLQQMGLVHLQGRHASLACELFRLFFWDLVCSNRKNKIIRVNNL